MADIDSGLKRDLVTCLRTTSGRVLFCAALLGVGWGFGATLYVRWQVAEALSALDASRMPDERGRAWSVSDRRGEDSANRRDDTRQLSPAVMNASATEAAGVRDWYVLAFTTGLLSDVCDQAEVQIPGASRLDEPRGPVGSNSMLHRCEYLREMKVNGCMPSGTCPTFDAWRESNAAFDPQLPRDQFLALLSARRSKASR